MELPINNVHNIQEITIERPVYIYGYSGRCWVFKNKQYAIQYLSKLFDFYDYINISRISDILVNKYGKTILERLSKINLYITNPIILESDYSVNIFNNNTLENKGCPTKYTYFYDKANISIVTNYILYRNEDILHYLLPEEDYFICLLKVLSRHNTTERCKLKIDYLLGDHIMYNEPQHINNHHSSSIIHKLFYKCSAYEII